MLFGIGHITKFGNNAEEISPDEPFDIPGALDAIIDKAEADGDADKNE